MTLALGDIVELSKGSSWVANKQTNPAVYSSLPLWQSVVWFPGLQRFFQRPFSRLKLTHPLWRLGCLLCAVSCACVHRGWSFSCFPSNLIKSSFAEWSSINIWTLDGFAFTRFRKIIQNETTRRKKSPYCYFLVLSLFMFWCYCRWNILVPQFTWKKKKKKVGVWILNLREGVFKRNLPLSINFFVLFRHHPVDSKFCLLSWLPHNFQRKKDIRRHSNDFKSNHCKYTFSLSVDFYPCRN